MTNNVDLLERDVVQRPDMLDRLFGREFSIAELVRGAEDAGYEIGTAELEGLSQPSRTAELSANVKLKVPVYNDTDISELDIAEIELVAAGVLIPSSMSPYSSFANVNTVLNVNVYVVAAAAALVLVIVGVGVFVFPNYVSGSCQQ